MSGKMMREIGFAGVLLAMALVGCGSAAAMPSTGMVSETAMPPTHATVSQGEALATARVDSLTTVAAWLTATGPVPTHTPGPTYTPSIAPSPTSIPTPTATALLTPIPLSDGPLMMEGPLLIFRTVIEGVLDRDTWVMNADGTRLTSLDDVGEFFEPSPVGSLDTSINLAYVTGRPPTLKIMSLPSREVVTITELGTAFGDYTLRTAIERGGLVWSHDGRKLAFVGAMDETSIEVYVYSLDTGRITRVTNSPANATDLRWSPDDSYILYGESPSYPEQFDGNFEIWSRRADGSGSGVRLQDLAFRPAFRGWYDDSTVALSALDYDSGRPDVVRLVDIKTGQASLVREGFFISTAYDPQSNVWVITETLGDTNCDEVGGQLVFVTTEGEQSFPTTGCGLVYWVENAGVFLAYWDEYNDQASIMSREGQITAFTAPYPVGWVLPVVSPDGHYWAWECTDAAYGVNETGLWISTGATSMRRIYDGFVFNMIWSPDSITLFFAGDGRIYMASAPDFDPVLIADTSDHVTYPVFEGARWIP